MTPNPFLDPQPASPAPPTPQPKRSLGDYWSLVLLLFAVVFGLLGLFASPDDSATMFGLRQGALCYLVAVLCVVVFVAIGRYNRRKFGRWFTNQSSQR